MQFDSDHKVFINTLTKDEARAFIFFLGRESRRHKDAIGSSFEQSKEYPQCAPFFESGILRHGDDIFKIDLLINDVKEWFGI